MDLTDYNRRARDAVVAAWASAFAPPERISVSEWADRNRLLTSSETSEPGPWKTSRVPFIREIQDSLSITDPTQIVVFMKSTQVAGTESGVNWSGYVVDQAASPMLVVEPSIEIAELWSKQRLANMINACDRLARKIPPARSRDGGNTTLLKEYPGGVLRIGGANSAKSLRSMPVKNLFLDEVDGYPDDLDGEGDPIGLAMERTNNFPRRKVLMVSTPTVRGASNIEKWFLRSDQRYYHVPCPHCLHKQRLVRDRMKYLFEDGREGDPDGLIDAVYICEDCGAEIAEHNKTWMLEQGEWVASSPGREIRGYHINSFYSPLGLGRTWRERAQEFLRAQKDPVELKRHINTALGETWEDRSSSIKHEALMQRAGHYRLGQVPKGALVLTAGIDTQDDRLEVYVWGWGRGERCWIVDRVIITGSPAAPDLPGAPSVWTRLAAQLERRYINCAGIEMRIEAAAIDSAGHHTQSVYGFVREWRGACPLRAIIGRANKTLVSRPSQVDVAMGGGTLKNGLHLWTVGTDPAKGALFGRLLADIEADPSELFINFAADLDEDFYQQLTAEVFDVVHNRWVKKKGQPRNEALDCWVYAYWAACAPPLRLATAHESDWASRELLLEPPTADLFAGATPLVPRDPDPQPRLRAEPEAQPEQSPADDGAFLHPQGGGGWLPDSDDYWND